VREGDGRAPIGTRVPCLLKRLADLGANMYAVDDGGRTALHRVLYAQADSFRSVGLRPWVDLLIAKAPELLTMADSMGRT